VAFSTSGWVSLFNKLAFPWLPYASAGLFGSHEVAGALQKKSSLKGEEKRGRRGEDPTCITDANLFRMDYLLIDSVPVPKKPRPKFRAKMFIHGPVFQAASRTCLTDT